MPKGIYRRKKIAVSKRRHTTDAALATLLLQHFDLSTTIAGAERHMSRVETMIRERLPNGGTSLSS